MPHQVDNRYYEIFWADDREESAYIATLNEEAVDEEIKQEADNEGACYVRFELL
jgi:hypothetical protein